MTDTLDGVELPEGMAFRAAWTPIQQSVSRAGDGTLRLQEQEKIGGRPITLASRKDGAQVYGDAPYSLYTTLAAMLTAGRQMTLVARGVSYTVGWRHADGPPLEYELLEEWSDSPVSTDRCLLTIRLQTIP